MYLTEENNMNSRVLNIAVIGGGLVGSLVALNLAKVGHKVDLYEYRKDMRKERLVQGRSINLALSHRGQKALSKVGLEDAVLKTAIPMYGRMLHISKGKTSTVIYDPTSRNCLYSVGRKTLNEILLTAGEKLSNLEYHFEHKLEKVNLNNKTMEFFNLHTKTTLKLEADLIIGCDGAYSSVRQQMIKIPGYNFSQEYIEHQYLELCIPAKDGQFQMPENYLHIWPRDTFMMIALPNQDKSFTVTLSMPAKIFQSIKSSEHLLSFFQKYYEDAVSLIGKENLIADFFKSEPQPLVSIKCNPYHYKGNVVLLGDAAHAMVPYFGQGMNAGMEDCNLFISILSQPNIDVYEALQKFSQERWQDAHAICDLAMSNYTEMRDLTKRFSFRCRKWVDTALFRLFPTIWIPLYNSVSFSSMKYKKCIENRKWQDQLLRNSFIVVVAVCSFGIYVVLGGKKI